MFSFTYFYAWEHFISDFQYHLLSLQSHDLFFLKLAGELPVISLWTILLSHYSLSLSFVPHCFRHEENIAALETSLRSEKQQTDVIMKQLADSQGEIGELQRKLEDADGRNGLLQDSLQRLDSYLRLISNVVSQLPIYSSVKMHTSF